MSIHYRTSNYEDAYIDRPRFTARSATAKKMKLISLDCSRSKKTPDSSWATSHQQKLAEYIAETGIGDRRSTSNFPSTKWSDACHVSSVVSKPDRRAPSAAGASCSTFMAGQVIFRTGAQ